MGVGRSALKRIIRMPVETQGHLEKVLKNEPKVAPKHETVKELLAKSRTENQAPFDAYNRKSEDYLNLLKRIHVDSVDINKEENELQKDHVSRDTTSSMTNQTGSLRSEQLMLLFRQRMINPEEWNEEKIATYFELPPESVKNLLEHYSDFNVEPAPQLPEPLQDITV